MILEILAAIAVSTGAVLVFVLVVFGISRAIQRIDIADIAWGPGIVVAALAALLFAYGAGARPLLATALVVIWGVRLAVHIWLRRRGRPEDKRYAEMRKEWKGNTARQSLLRVFLLQGALMPVIALPVIVISATSGPGLGLLDYIGVVVWAVGYVFEVVGDSQLSSFIKNPKNKGKLMTSGLWRYTRHPNYFGEVTQWWGIYLIALSVPYGWLTIVGPFTITWLIIKVSGVPLLEKAYSGRPDFEDYKSRTNKFFPGILKRSA